MQKIIPCLWFDNEAEEATRFYTDIFPNSKLGKAVPYTTETPSNKKIGSTMTVSFEIEGFKMLGLNGGPYFKINPSISFIVNFDPSKNKNARSQLDQTWKKLSTGGKILMPLNTYPFSDHYGWVQDKYGVSWQLILTNPEGDVRPTIIPSLLFTKDICGLAEEASSLYISIFKDSKRGALMRYGKNQKPDKEGTIMFTDFALSDQWFSAMDSAADHKFKFNEGLSFIIESKDQKEIDYFYDRLSADPNAEICGWLKDKYGVSWQLVTPEVDKFTENKVTMEELMKMKRIDVTKLEKIYKINIPNKSIK